MKNLKKFILYAYVILFQLITCACSQSTNFSEVNKTVDESPSEIVDVSKLNGQCVQVFYDSSQDPMFKFGRTHALMLLNLLGHFPEYRQIIGPVEQYKKGYLERCHASFYIGSVYDNKLPSDFLDDYKTTTKHVIWLGYNFWQLGTDFEKIFGYATFEFTTLDYANPTADGKPGFFRDVLYKGEVFPKFSTWSSTPPPPTATPAVSQSAPLPPVPQQALIAAFEVTKLLNKTSAVSTTLAETRHSFTNEVIPWAIKANNKFFVTESPFSFIHESDRYFVFADLLFDFLEAQPKHNSKNAILRLEDIHPLVEMNYLDDAVNILRKNSIVPHIMLIPIFSDPLLTIPRDGDTRTEIRMENAPEFSTLIQKYKNVGSVFIWHGVTHQYSNLKNPFSGSSGDDYEFWDWIHGQPIAEDSTDYVLNKLNNGFESLRLFSIYPKLWVTPHYHASALDNVIFGQVFNWTIGRGVYSDTTIKGLSSLEGYKSIAYANNLNGVQANRQAYFSKLKVSENPGVKQFGQLFPYEIYGNIYGQNVIPENLGNVQPYLSDQVVNTRNVDKILEDAKRNLVLRDVWASVFYHPFLLDPLLNAENVDPTKAKDLERLVLGIKSLGYKFINLDDYAAVYPPIHTQPIIELENSK